MILFIYKFINIIVAASTSIVSTAIATATIVTASRRASSLRP